MSCRDEIFILKQITKKRRELNLETHTVFTDYEYTSLYVESYN